MGEKGKTQKTWRREQEKRWREGENTDAPHHTTMHTDTAFPSSNGWVLDKFGVNITAHTVHKHRQLTTTSHVTLRLSHSLSICPCLCVCRFVCRTVWYVFCLRLFVFAHVMVCVVCVLRASSLPYCAVGACVSVAVAAPATCPVLPRAADCPCCVGILRLLSDRHETDDKTEREV